MAEKNQTSLSKYAVLFIFFTALLIISKPPAAAAFCCFWDPVFLDDIHLTVGEKFIHGVSCEYDCTIKATSDDPSIATVSPAVTSVGTEAVSFTITGVTSGSTSVYFEAYADGLLQCFWNSGVVVSSPPPPGPSISISPAGFVPNRFDFPKVPLNGSDTETLTISNIGGMELLIGSIGAADPLEAPFNIHEDGCSNITLPPSSSCDIEITFSPKTGGVSTDSFSIPSTDPDTPVVTETVRGETQPPTKSTTAESNGNTASTDDPVSTATGEYYFAVTDLALGGPLNLSFSRYYATLLTNRGNIISAIGYNWMHNFDLKLVVNGSDAKVVYYHGKSIVFQKKSEGWALQNAEPHVYQLLESGTDYRLMDPARTRIFTFDGDGKLTRIEDRNGNALALTYDGDALAQVADGLGRTLNFTYTSGKLTDVLDQTGRSVSFAYSGDNLTAATDARGNTSTYSYQNASPDLLGMMTAKTLPEGNTPYRQEYDSEGSVVRQKDSGGHWTQIAYSYPSAGIAITTVTDPLGHTMRHTHEDLQRLTAVEDQDGEIFTLSYDDHNHRAGLTDRLGDTVSTIYDPASGRVASRTDALGHTTSYTYTAQAQEGFTFYDLSRIDYPDGTFVTISRDGAGNPLTITNQAGKSWTYTYNNRGQLLTAANPAGGVVTYTYNNDGTPASVTDPFGNTTTFGYDALLRLTAITHPDATSRQFTRDANDNLLSVTNELGKTTSYTYDKNNNLVTITDPAGKTIAYAYDDNDQLVSITDQLGKTSVIGRDQMGRAAAITNADNETVTLGYNAHGWLDSVTDPGGGATTFAHDKEGVLAAVTDPLGRTWNYATDKLGRVTGVTSPLTATSSRTLDSMGRTTAVTDPLGRTGSYTYDSRGLLTGAVRPAGINAAYARNDLGRITRITDPNGNFWDRSYDQAGRLVGRTDPLGHATSYSYDTRSRLSRVTFPAGYVDITYDAAGHVRQKAYSDGLDLNYTYDDNGRLLTAADLALTYDARGEVIDSNGLAIGRDNAGRISTITFATDKTVTYTYNSQGLVTGVSDWLGGTTNFTYDAAGSLLTISRSNGVTTSNTYDNDGRLTGITAQKAAALVAAITLSRNQAGEITAATRDVPLPPFLQNRRQTTSYDAAHRQRNAVYNRNGSLLTAAGHGYGWDMASRLTAITRSGHATTFAYDGLGMRVSRTSGAISREYVWNYALGLPSISVVREGGHDLRYYVHLPSGRLLYSIDAADNSRRFYHFDEMGNTLFLTDDQGGITDSYGVTPYGLLTRKTGTTDNPFTFLGAWGVMQEGDTGLYYMRARYYDCNLARFISPDLKRSIVTTEINPYIYAGANPLLYSDPSGLSMRVNQADVHTDISVDVWEGGEVIGVLDVSFAGANWHSSGYFNLFIWGIPGEFTWNFRPGESIISAGTDPNIRIVPGTAQQDKRLVAVLLKILGKNRESLRKIKKQSPTVAGTGYWSTYRALTNCCNDFTDAMLDIYFGENWHLGPLFVGSGVMKALSACLARKKEERYVRSISKLDPASRDINAHIHQYGDAILDSTDDSGIANLYPR